MRKAVFVLLFLLLFGVTVSQIHPVRADDLTYECDGGQGTNTAIGCIPKNLKPFLGFILRWALGISGGLILLMVIATGYSLLTSQGNPEKLQAAKENIISIFSGLILIGFSLVLLQVIGADILKLPTF